MTEQAQTTAHARMVASIAEDASLTQGEKVLMSEAARLLADRPDLATKVAAALADVAAEALTLRVWARVNADVQQVASIRRRMEQGACALPCEDCTDDETGCRLAGSLPVGV